MRLYRYRPLNGFLFKELKYREIYLARYGELNDPQDLSCTINYHSLEKEYVGALVHLMFMELALSREPEDFLILKDLFSDECLGEFLLERFTGVEGNKIYEENLREVMSVFYALHVTGRFPSHKTPRVSELFDLLSNLTSSFLKNSSVACFSETYDNFLMWSHYASGHSGVCLEFEMEPADNDGKLSQCKILTEFGKLYKGEPMEYWTHLNRVHYNSEVTDLNFYDYYQVFANKGDIDLMNLSKSRWHYYADEIKKIFVQKLDPWSEEKEWRIVNVEFQPSMPEDRILKYTEDSLKAVYFGANTDIDNQLRIANIVGKDVQYYQCSVNGTKTLDTNKVDIDALREQQQGWN